MTGFAQAFARVVGLEGEFSGDPDDPGNWTGGSPGRGVLKGTKFGISAKSYPGLDIANLTLADARVIYVRDYWQPMRCDDLPEPLRYPVFDGGVNSGITASARWLQLAATTADDGVIGAVTLSAIERHDPYLLLCRYSGYRLRYMADAAIWPKQGRGWARRVAGILVSTEDAL